MLRTFFCAYHLLIMVGEDRDACRISIKCNYLCNPKVMPYPIKFIEDKVPGSTKRGTTCPINAEYVLFILANRKVTNVLAAIA